MRHANYGNADHNQAEIVAALRKVGATVAITSGVGDGYPDLTVGFRGETYLMEVKVGQALLNERESKWHQTWRGRPVSVVRSTEDALRAIGMSLSLCDRCARWNVSCPIEPAQPVLRCVEFVA